MSLIFSLLLFSSKLDPTPVLFHEGFHIINAGKAIIAVSPGDDISKRSDYLYEQYLKALLLSESKLKIQVEMKPYLIDCATRTKFRNVLSAFLHKDPPDYAVAVALPGHDIIVIDRARFGYPEEIDSYKTLIHEVTHLLLHKKFRRIPRWIDEGLAMWTAGQQVGPREAQTLSYWALRKGIMPFGEIMKEFPWKHDLASFAYVQSLSLISYLVDQKGLGDIWKLLNLYQEESLRKAWQRVFSEEPEKIWERWRVKEAKKFNPIQFILEEIPVFTYPALLLIIAYIRYRLKRKRFYLAEEEDMILHS